MTRRGRVIAISVLAVTVVLVAGSWWRIMVDRDGQSKALSEVGHTTAVLVDTRSELAGVLVDAGTTEAVTERTVQERDALAGLAASLQAEIARTQSQRNTTAISAFTTGARAGVLARCLGGVQQALNQLSVGDAGALASLRKVEQPCREAGV